MIKNKQIILWFSLAILVAVFGLFVAIIQYQPLSPYDNEKLSQTNANNQNFSIPIFSEDPIIGNKKAANTAIIFSDFGCEACQVQNQLLTELLIKYPEKIKIIWKGLVVTKFPQSTEEAVKYAYCANEQKKFTEFANLAYNSNNNFTSLFLDSAVENLNLNKNELANCLNSPTPGSIQEKNKQLASILNIQAVPTIFFNNKQINTPQSIEEWESLLANQ